MAGDVHWVRTVGAPQPNDPRDGELHQVFDELPDHFDLEPWDTQLGAKDARYMKSDRPAVIDDEGRLIWVYEYNPNHQ